MVALLERVRQVLPVIVAESLIVNVAEQFELDKELNATWLAQNSSRAMSS